MGKFFAGVAASALAAVVAGLILSHQYGPVSIYRLLGGFATWTYHRELSRTLATNTQLK